MLFTCRIGEILYGFLILRWLVSFGKDCCGWFVTSECCCHLFAMSRLEKGDGDCRMSVRLLPINGSRSNSKEICSCRCFMQIVFPVYAVPCVRDMLLCMACISRDDGSFMLMWMMGLSHSQKMDFLYRVGQCLYCRLVFLHFGFLFGLGYYSCSVSAMLVVSFGTGSRSLVSLL